MTEFRDIAWKVPKPEWKVSYNEEFNRVSWHPEINPELPKFWEIEDRILKTAVVDILRSEGYTVIEPGGRDG